MSYNKDVYIKVLSDFANKRDLALEDSRQVKDKIYLQVPELKQIEKDLSATGEAIIKAFLLSDTSTTHAGFTEEIALVNKSLQEKRIRLLRANGYTEDELNTKYQCKKCNDEGYIAHNMCDCFKQALQKEAMSRLNFGKSFAGQTFEQFNLNYYSDVIDTKFGASPREMMADNLAICKDFANKIDVITENLLMMGNTGLGKTFLSAAIATVAVERGHSVIYDTAFNILHNFELAHFDRNEKSMEFTDMILNCDLLIIDDLGAEFSTQFTISTIYNIINSRTMANKKMVINTNLSQKEIESKYSNRILSRLLGDFVLLDFIGEDIRLQKIR